MEEYLKGLKIKSKNLTMANVDLEIVEVNTRPLSWLVRLFFYVFCLFWICFAMFRGLLHSKEKVFEEHMPQTAALINFLISILIVRMMLIYYFIAVNFFWALFIPTSIMKLVKSCEKVRVPCFYLTFLFISLLFLLAVLIFDDAIPYFILYFNVILAIERHVDREITKNGFEAVFWDCITSSIFSCFVFFNPGNNVFYGVDVVSFGVWLGLTLLVTGYNIFLFCNPKFGRCFAVKRKVYDTAVSKNSVSSRKKEAEKNKPKTESKIHFLIKI